jgi:N-acetylglucosaminyldiphosphoundecaprenol N-acetyl-beta-D-mannosaminyltransferase
MNDTMHIFGVRVDNLSRAEILDKVDGFLEGKSSRRLATVNPEFLLLALENDAFRGVLNACDLNVADGFGLHLAFWREGERLKGRFPGADLMRHMLSLAEEKGLKVFLAAREGGLSGWQETADALKKCYPELIVSGADLRCHPEFTERSVLEEKRSLDFARDDMVGQVRDYDIVFCNFGAPDQEMFLSSLKRNPGNVRLAMGVGGSFDYLSGKIKRAPRWMRICGLEWLWRLIRQPRRWRRIWNAVAVFPWTVMREK